MNKSNQSYKLVTDSSSFLKTEQSSINEDITKTLIKKDVVDLNDQLNVIITKYSLIKNRLNKLWNKID
jgi:hypothetical protein